MRLRSARVCIFQLEASIHKKSNRRSFFNASKDFFCWYHIVGVLVKILFAAFSKFGALYFGFLKYINTDIQIILVSPVGNPLQAGYKSGGNRF